MESYLNSPDKIGTTCLDYLTFNWDVQNVKLLTLLNSLENGDQSLNLNKSLNPINSLIPYSNLFCALDYLDLKDHKEFAKKLIHLFPIATEFLDVIGNSNSQQIICDVQKHYPDALLNLAESLIEDGQICYAIECYLSLNDFSKRSVIFSKAKSTPSFTQWDKMVQYLRKAKQADPSSDILKQLVVALSKAGKEDEILDLNINDEDNTCKLCLDAPTKIVMVPCGHMLCGTCCTKVDNCHVCRDKITLKQKFFNA